VPAWRSLCLTGSDSFKKYFLFFHAPQLSGRQWKTMRGFNKQTAEKNSDQTSIPQNPRATIPSPRQEIFNAQSAAVRPRP